MLMATKPEEDDYDDDYFDDRKPPYARRPSCRFASLPETARDTIQASGVRHFCRAWHLAARLVVWRRILLPGLYVVQASANLCLAGWRSRRLAVRLPALLVVLLVGGLALARTLKSNTELLQRYLQAADSALREKDYAAARNYFQKALQLGSSRPEVRYALALCQEGTGHDALAASLMARLAPADKAGYYPAHVWQAQRLLRSAKPTDADRRLAEVHLLLALQQEPGEAGAHALLAQLYWDSARFNDAEPHLVSAAPAAPALYLRLAELQSARRDWQRAAQEADLAVPFFRDRCRSAPQDVPAHVFWAEAEMLAGRHADAVRILRAELGSVNQPVYLQALGRVYASWAAAVERDAKADPAQRLQLVEEGLKYDAGNSDLLSALTPERTRPGEAVQTRALLQRLLSDGRAAGGGQPDPGHGRLAAP